MNTNKTYVAFDAQGVYDHEHSNLHYHQQMREWQRQYPQRYAFLNMQDIDFSSMHEDLIDSTFKVRCLRQMAANLPNKVRKYIGRDSAYMAHVPFTKDKLERALGAYSVKKGLYPWNSTTIF